ncbi:MAG: hypothetical protein GY759_01635 [Chloroflexi bacterium]|nr:hypothetical protein [Chloroflexota bacterium]
MRIKVDEDLPAVVAELLQAQGYDSVTVIDQGMGGWKDPALWQVVQKEERFLVTADKGFGDVRYYPPGKHAGVLLLRPDEHGIRPLIELMQKVLTHYRIEALQGLLTVATPRSIRIRRSR